MSKLVVILWSGDKVLVFRFETNQIHCVFFAFLSLPLRMVKLCRNQATKLSLSCRSLSPATIYIIPHPRNRLLQIAKVSRVQEGQQLEVLAAPCSNSSDDDVINVWLNNSPGC
jgi:uncharacterized membrane protein (UPF0127 family)